MAIQTVGVIGAGTMGNGIAHVFARTGHHVILCDVEQRFLDRALVTAHALGFSQGASTVSRWVALGKAKIDRLILWGGEFPPDLDLTLDTTLGRLRAARLALVYGRSDEYITPKVVSGMVERLRQHGIPYAEIPFDGGHELDEAVLRELAAS